MISLLNCRDQVILNSLSTQNYTNFQQCIHHVSSIWVLSLVPLKTPFYRMPDSKGQRFFLNIVEEKSNKFWTSTLFSFHNLEFNCRVLLLLKELYRSFHFLRWWAPNFDYTHIPPLWTFFHFLFIHKQKLLHDNLQRLT